MIRQKEESGCWFPPAQHYSQPAKQKSDPIWKIIFYNSNKYFFSELQLLYIPSEKDYHRTKFNNNMSFKKSHLSTKLLETPRLCFVLLYLESSYMAACCQINWKISWFSLAHFFLSRFSLAKCDNMTYVTWPLATQCQDHDLIFCTTHSLFFSWVKGCSHNLALSRWASTSRLRWIKIWIFHKAIRRL